MPSIYLDHHATTPVDPRVLDAMLPYFSTHFGNAASRQHVFGWEAEEAVTIARKHVAECIGAEASEIVFTSGATESNNLALKGLAEMYGQKKRHLITTAIEHKCVLDVCEHLEKFGYSVTILPVDEQGFVDPDDIKKAITHETLVVSVIMANNEIGTIQHLKEISQITRERGVFLHSDMAQSFGKIDAEVNELGIDLASISAHKIYGPKGVGALYVRRKNPRVKIAPQMDGGGHENNMRSGTLNVPGIVGMGKAAELARMEFEENFWKYVRLRHQLFEGLHTHIPECSLNGPDILPESVLRSYGTAQEASKRIQRLPNNLNMSFGSVPADNLMMAAKEIAVSTGSACMSATREPSYVLKAVGLNDDISRSSIRFGIGRTNTEQEIAYAVSRLSQAMAILNSASSA
ncbi:aminotransferase class V-fold PLP-dependent enzyme [bacterium]|nr:aminotransferase class V-fold PLP-dependent enzyme [bacterium]